jgi:hypothetical protein
MSEQSGVDVPASISASRFPEAYTQRSAEMRALPTEQLQPININIPYAVTAMLGAMPEIVALRARVVAELPAFPVELFDKLESATLAMGYADTMYTMSTRKPEALPQLVQRATRMCDIFRADANSLATRELIDGAPLEQLRGGSGHRNIAFDLFALTYLLRSNWSAIQGKSAVTLAELTDAEHLADQLATALGVRQQSPSPEAPSADMRLRAFNLFLRVYEEVLRAVRFLRKDWEDIVPSIHTPRGPAKKAAAEEERATPASTGVHPAVQAPAQAGAEPEPIAVGMPGASPYTKG